MPTDLILIILVLLAGFYMAWNIGANDVSNAMGTAVGSGALTLFKAVVIAGTLEFCGAFFLGGNVSQTVQEGLVDPAVFAQNPKILSLGMLSALISTALWLQIASYCRWPVSTTHAIIGALVGFGALIGGIEAVQWGHVGQIALSWVISPVLSGFFAFFIFTILQKKVLFAINPILASKWMIPLFTFLLLIVFTLSIFFKGVGSFHLSLSEEQTLLLSLSIGALGASISFFLIRNIKPPKTLSSNLSHQLLGLNKARKHLRRVQLISKEEERGNIDKILEEVETCTTDVRNRSELTTNHSDYQIIEKMFGSLQILSASYVAFAHGANDVANAIGPVAAALTLIRSGELTSSFAPPWLLAMGGIGIVIGLATWGWRVMETIGKKITELTPTRGFSAEFGAAITILVASKCGLPISTTHCIVGAVLGVGLARGIRALNLRVLRDIVLSWVITIPASAIVCILTFFILRLIFN